MLTVAVGDIHGCYDELLQLMHHVQIYTIGKPTKYVFLGDYIDRGPKSKEVIDYLMDLDNSCYRSEKEPHGLGAEEHVFLRGNHEDMALGESPNYKYNGTENGFHNWMSNGGWSTLASYGEDVNHIPIHKQIPNDHLHWLKATTLYYHDGLRTFVHAGIVRGIPIKMQNHETLTWIRHEFLNDPRMDGGYIVHGHTPGFNVDLQPNRCNLDTACVYGYRFGVTGGVLSAAIFNEKQVEPYLIVNNNGIYQEVKKRTKTTGKKTTPKRRKT